MTCATSPRRPTGLLGAAACAIVLLGAAGPALADVYLYWKGPFGSTWQIGTLGTSVGMGISESGEATTTAPTAGGSETHMAIVCEGADCRFEGDCKSCHATPQRTTTFTRQVADQHRQVYFPRAAMTVGTTPVAYGSGFVQMVSGRMVILDQDRRPSYRLPADARLVRDTRTGRPLLITYAGTAQPERIR